MARMATDRDVEFHTNLGPHTLLRERAARAFGREPAHERRYFFFGLESLHMGRRNRNAVRRLRQDHLSHHHTRLWLLAC
jgi:hypothetical protein